MKLLIYEKLLLYRELICKEGFTVHALRSVERVLVCNFSILRLNLATSQNAKIEHAILMARTLIHANSFY